MTIYFLMASPVIAPVSFFIGSFICKTLTSK